MDEKAFGALDPLDYRSCYPESKRAAETLLKSYRLQYGVAFNTVRIAHSYGPTMKLENDGRVMADMMGDVVAGRDIVLKSSGEAIRSFLYITDAILGLFAILFHGEEGKGYNLANEREPITIRELALKIANLQKGLKVSSINSEEGRKGYCNYQRIPLDTTAIESLGWKVQVTLDEGIRRCFLCNF